MLEKLSGMYNFCARPQCRHKVFVNYFGQEYHQNSCQACDYCLGEMDMVDDPLGLGQKILNGVASISGRPGHGFGAAHLANVLKGSETEQVTRWNHQSTLYYGALASETLAAIRYLLEQLISQGMVERQGEYDVLCLTETGRRVLAGELTPILAKPLVAEKKKEISVRQKARKASEWQDVDEQLFEILRAKRAELARKQGVPAYIIFGDKSLKDMASRKPVTHADFSKIFGVGEHKLKIYAQPFIAAIKAYLPGPAPA
jgi:ATP-dependent DNA helicase RecQ